ncbi:headcase protein homolog [Corticium candelabrum]|uniref:headcase protein homolog n=1 Tax=Corticium candelabrum TaxID=121492 RepID=UPI002E254E30|nr:headcase protein homolog [Corticium candelabrum]
MPFSREEKAAAQKAAAVAAVSSSSTEEDEEECCKPGGCLHNTKISAEQFCDAVRVICNNDQCTHGNFMHADCFSAFEDGIINFLKGIGRARSWSDKQRRQNLWTKKGYDLAYKSCGCSCGKGYIRKDLNYNQPKREMERADDGRAAGEEGKGKRRRRKGGEKPSLGNSRSVAGASGNGEIRASERYSVSPPKQPQTRRVPPSPTGKVVDDAWEEPWMTASNGRRRSGSATKNGFQRRRSAKCLQQLLSPHKINNFQVRMEDETHVTDDVKPIVHETLSYHHTNCIDCLVCGRRLVVFDKFPLLDGTFFLTPVSLAVQERPKQTFPVSVGSQTQLLAAVCIYCLLGHNSITCKACSKTWDGSSHQLGSCYSYDIFAASPCCPARLACNNCQSPVVESTNSLSYFSDFSHQLRCPHCDANDYHFIKPVDQIFNFQVV